MPDKKPKQYKTLIPLKKKKSEQIFHFEIITNIGVISNSPVSKSLFPDIRNTETGAQLIKQEINTVLKYLWKKYWKTIFQLC